MKAILVDEKQIIQDNESALLRRSVGPKLMVLRAPEDVLSYLRLYRVDVAFVEATQHMSLAAQMKRIQPRLNLIFLCPDESYCIQAMHLHASGCLLRPLREEMIHMELDDLRYPHKNTGVLYARAFGNFELFYDGEPVLFRYRKSKELMAYLIDRKGAVISKDEMITVLWGGDLSRGNYYKQILKDLTDTLSALGMEDILIKRRGYIGLRTDEIRCDYYEWLRGSTSSTVQFRGEYMRQYDWAEATWLGLEGKSRLWQS